MADLREVHHTRFLLQPTALQLFFDPSSALAPVLLATSGAASAARLSSALVARAPQATKLDRQRKIEAAATAARKWSAGEMSNFDYLMRLNTLAGRSYADLSQYPIFPWVLSDWTSETINLGDPGLFRDLSKPIGALEPKRLDAFRERYRSLQEEEGLAPFFYGTHYSTASIVMWYLVRLEPFTSLSRNLQVCHCLQAALFASKGFSSFPLWLIFLQRSALEPAAGLLRNLGTGATLPVPGSGLPPAPQLASPATQLHNLTCTKACLEG
jgi:hypothetical protein